MVFGFCIYWTLTDAMGQTDSHFLSIVLAHFNKGKARAHNLLVDMKKGEMTAYCSSEWLPFDVGWQP